MGVKDDLPPAQWSEPRAAYVRYRPGLSPYLHYYYDLRAARGEVSRAPTHGPDDGAAVPGQLAEALRALIDRSFK